MIHPAVLRIGLGLLIWILASVALFEVLGLLSYERVFVASLIGFLAVRELVSPGNVPSRWRTRLNWILGAALVAFAILIGYQILTLV